MGFSFRPLGRRITDIFDANSQDDQKRRLAAGQPRMYLDQQRQLSSPTQIPYNQGIMPATPQRNVASRVFDQVNPFDNNRTWQQTTPTNTKSLWQQGVQSGSQLVRGTAPGIIKSVNTAKAGVGGLYGLGEIGASSVFGTDQGYQNTLSGVDATMKRDLSPNAGALGLGTVFKNYNEALNATPLDIAKKSARYGVQNYLEGKSLSYGAPVGDAIMKEGVVQGIKSQVPNLIKNFGLNAAQGGVTAYNQGASRSDILKSGLLNAFAGTVGDVGLGIGGAVIGDIAKAPKTALSNVTSKLVGNTPLNEDGFLSLGGNKKRTPEQYRMEIKNRLQEEYNQFALNKDQWRKDTNNPSAKAQFTENGRMFKEYLKNPDTFIDKYNLMPPEMQKPKVSLKTKTVSEALAPVQNPGDSSLFNNTTLNQPANNLDINMERFKATRNPNAVKPGLSVAEQVGRLSDDQMVTQMVNDLGVSENVARKIVADNNKAAIATNLYGSKDLIRGADSPDAYATKVMGEANKRGQAALNQNAPQVSKTAEPTVILKEQLANVDTPRTEAPNIKQFIDNLPDTRQTTRVNADAIIGEGTQWLRKGGQAIDDALRAKGDTFENFNRVIQQAYEDVVAGKKPNVSTFHQSLYDTLEPILGRLLKESGLDIKKLPYYLPRMKKGGEMIPMGNTLVDAIDSATMGSQFKRTGALSLDDADLSPESLARYATQTLSEKYRHTMAVDDIIKAADERGAPISMKQATDAVDMKNQLANDLADAAKKGKDFTNDTVSDLNKLGKMENIPQKVNNYSPTMFAQTPENILKGGNVLRDGFEQYDYAHGYGNEFVDLFTQNNIPKEQFGDALRQSILKQNPNADIKVVDNAVNYVTRTMQRQGLEPSATNGLVIQAYKNVAKDQMVNLGKTTQFTNNKMRKVISEQINGRLLKDAHEQNASQIFNSLVTDRVNVSLRGLNVTSAVFELGDIGNIFSNYGLKNLKSTKFGLGKIDGDNLRFSHKYGEADASYMTPDMPQIKALDTIWENPNTSYPSKMWQSYRHFEDKLLVFRYVEQHKTELFFRTAEKFYRDKGLSGGELVNRVMSDYKNTMLPYKLSTANRIIGKMPKALTQYANWSIQATKRLGRTISGTNEAGKFGEIDRGARIARGIGTELLPKAAAAALLGVPVMQILGMRDYTGVTNSDFTGINNEDKTKIDEVVRLLSLSPALSLGGNFYYANRRNEIADAKKAAGDSYGTNRRPQDQPLNVALQSGQMLLPFRTQWKKTTDVLDAKNRGYYMNRDGRVQTQGPQGLEALQGAVFGKDYTPTMREYQDNPNIVSVLQGKAKPQDLITKNESVSTTIQNFGGTSTRDFKRPLSADVRSPYSQKYINASPGDRPQILESGRSYNKEIDTLKKESPQKYQIYIDTMKDNVDPEKWNKRTNGGSDLTTFKMEAERNKLLKKDFGTPYDPVYDLPDAQAKQYATYKSVVTGEDLALRNVLNKEEWYKKFKEVRAKYYENNPYTVGTQEYKNTERVKQWDALDNELGAYVYDKNAKEVPGWAKDYPLVYQKKAIIAKYGYDSQERKDFNKTYYDQELAQKDQYEKAQLNVINQMRKIENANPMSWEAYQQATAIANTDGTSSKFSQKAKTGGSAKSGRFTVSFKQDSTIKLDKTAAKIKQKSNYAVQKPKVSIKKSLV